MAAPGVDNVSSNQQVGVSTIDIPAFAVTGSNLLIFVGEGHSSPTAQNVVSVVRNAPSPETFTEIWAEFRGLSHRNSGHYFKGPVTGSYSITVTYTASEDEICAGAVSLTGVDQTTPLGSFLTNEGASGACTVTVPGVTADDIVIDMAYVFATALGAVGADQTERWAQENIGSFGSGGCSTQPGSAGGVMSWATGSEAFIIGGLVIHGITAAGASFPPYAMNPMSKLIVR